MDHSVIFLWVLLSATASLTTGRYGRRTTTTIPPTTNYPCGQAFSDASRSFNGPYYDGDRSVLECLWTIQSHYYLPIKAIIDYVELDCDHEYISIYSGEAHRSTLLGKICSGSSRTFVSFSGTMSVLLHRDSDITGPGFFAYYDIGELESTKVPELTVTAEETSSPTAIPWSTHVPESSTSGFHCGGLITAPSGYIYSPYYPGNGASMECIWEIQATSYDHIELEFYYIGYNLNCRTGYVEVYDGVLGSRKLGRVCSGSSYIYKSTSSRITIVLYMNSYQSGDAFNAYYYISTAVSTHSPLSEGSTSPPQNEEPMSPSASSSEPMSTSASSSEPMSTSGFHCGGILTASSGYIDSPYYPGNGMKMECIWEIQVAPYDRIVLQFYYISLNCRTDYIMIYDGSFGGRQLGKICNYSYYTYTSTSSIMTIVLYRKSYRSTSGFTAYYYSVPSASTVLPATNESLSQEPTTGDRPTERTTEEPTHTVLPAERTTEEVIQPSTLASPIPELTTSGPTTGGQCGGNISNPSGYISGPFYPGNNISEQCVWEITVEPFHYIILNFSRISLDCGTEYVEVIDGSPNYAFVLGRMCSDVYSSYNFTSTLNVLTILLHRDSDLPGYGFVAHYNSVQAPQPHNETTAPPPHSESTAAASTVPETTPTEEIYTSGHTVETTTVAEELTTNSSSVSTNTAGMGYITTLPSGSQCGGNFSNPYGYVFAPYYPGNNISEQCVWEITVDPFRYIVLRFYQISLDCSAEYVEIIDGGLNSPFVLGKMCSALYSNYTYTSTSNTMTILLHRDSDLSGNGFGAYYYSVQDPSPQPETTIETLSTTILPFHNETTASIGPATGSATVSSRSLSCSGEHMVARIRRTYLRSLGYNAWEVYLNSSDFRCRPQITYEYVIFNIPFNGCGTKRQESNKKTIIYSNIIKTVDPDHIITRKRNFQFHIMCEMNENTIVETMFVAQNSVDITEKHHGHYEMALGCYESPSFSHKVHGFPYYVSINQELYFEVVLNHSDPNLLLFLDTCKASPYAHDFENLTYPLIEHGCVRDSTYKNLLSPNKNTVRFAFNTFKFVDQHNEVFLQCNLVVCMANDYSSRCYQGCLSRKKRNVDEDQDRVDVVVGPFKRQEKLHEDKRQELVKNVNPGKDEAFSPLTVATALLAAMVFVLSGFLLSSKLRRKNYQQIY